MRRIDRLQRDQIDGLHSAYGAAGSGRLVYPMKNLETEILTPPEWIEGFMNLISRVARRAHLANEVMLWVDLWSVDLLGAPQGLTMGGTEGLQSIQGNENDLQDVFALIQLF